jgi:hypothetical protein
MRRCPLDTRHTAVLPGYVWAAVSLDDRGRPLRQRKSWKVAMSLAERLVQARREGCRQHLIRVGYTPELADRWCDAWEREAESRGWERTPEFWEHGRLWIEAQLALRRSPDALVARR